MMKDETLLSLAARVEEATGADRELDAQVWLATTPGATRRETVIPATPARKGWTIDETRDANHRLIIVPAYTASLDAAMTLVPKGWCRSVTDEQAGYAIAELWRREVNVCSRAKTWSLALTAAALKALSHGERG